MQVKTIEPSTTKKVMKLFDVGSAEIRSLQLPKGETIPEHATNKNIVIAVRTGKVLFQAEGEEIILTNETLLHMEPNETHSLTAIEDCEILVIVMP